MNKVRNIYIDFNVLLNKIHYIGVCWFFVFKLVFVLNVRAHIHTRAHTHTRLYTPTNMHIHTHTYARIRTPTRMHTHIHASRCTHVRTYRHTWSLRNVGDLIFFFFHVDKLLRYMVKSSKFRHTIKSYDL